MKIHPMGFPLIHADDIIEFKAAFCQQSSLKKLISCITKANCYYCIQKHQLIVFAKERVCYDKFVIANPSGHCSNTNISSIHVAVSYHPQHTLASSSSSSSSFNIRLLLLNLSLYYHTTSLYFGAFCHCSGHLKSGNNRHSRENGH
jgi:hypothetical protein